MRPLVTDMENCAATDAENCTHSSQIRKRSLVTDTKAPIGYRYGSSLWLQIRKIALIGYRYGKLRPLVTDTEAPVGYKYEKLKFVANENKVLTKLDPEILKVDTLCLSKTFL